ncbi:hypothetical protein [Nocardioides jishulii]|uniref:Uncharacterized protein n=1 Tax=Nocardioides jishulii TaxID=2575440 RepID=A0A4U2YT12_9ACTN|nr:hypothetical protein [Nocardioides jishulii]QCX26432.1 hypothetical protein FCL41_01905 [Nocardioides jishulii]TKI63762.1 hypothetical protein FC770_00800 [Nocardioides jishulii]
MDNKDSRTEICPDCGAVTGAGEHSCPAAPRADDTATIAIPPGLWDTGLFKPAWNRGGETGTSETPLVEGSLLSRPEDLVTPSSTGADTDVDGDPEADLGTDVEAEAPTDVETDAEPDAETDADADAELDADTDTDTDAGADAEAADSATVDDTAERPALADGEATQYDLAATQAWPMVAREQTPDQTAVRTPDGETTVLALAPAPASALTSATAVVPPVPTQDEPTAYDTDDAPRKRGKGLAILLSVALVAALIGGGWFWWQGTQDEPVREAFETSHGAFMNASTKLVGARSTTDISAAAEDFVEVTKKLEDTRSTANGRSTNFSSAVRRAVGAQLEVSRAAEQLTTLDEEEFGTWGAARGELKSGLEALSGVEGDIKTAGGSTEDLPGPALVTEADKVVGAAAVQSAERRTKELTVDLAAAERIKALRGIGNRAATGATSLSGAVDSLDGTSVDTAGLARHAAVQDALSKLTRLRPATLNQWEAIRTQVERKADELADGGTDLKVALTKADAMVTAATTAWNDWETQTESARTAKKDDVAAVKAARESIDQVLTEFTALDSSLASFLASGPQDDAGTAGATYSTLVAAADARDALRTQVLGLGTPPEVATEISALVTALGSSADTVRAAADAAAACTAGCSLAQAPAWTALVAAREAQAAAVTAAVEEWRTASTDAIKEIRKRELPEKPEI